ncbi:MAG: gluconeogenesis factor YvcK family protein [Aquihabitans sp.]
MSVEAVAVHPAVVAVGGGHGLAATLRAMRKYAATITAVVSVADDGGSSGRLRAEMPDLPAPGDVRRCLSALADPSLALSDVLEYRFDADAGDLADHAFGNLLLAALTRTLGSFTDAVDEVARLCRVEGRVMPATVEPVHLEAMLRASADTIAARVVGQVAVANARGPRHLGLRPADVASPPGVVDAILDADQVVVGPGSLFTSVLAAATVPDVHDALRRTKAQRVYVANLGPEIPETEGFTLDDHLRALRDHDVPVDVVLCPPGMDHEVTAEGVAVVVRPVADARGLVHAPEPLAAALAGLLDLGGAPGSGTR